MEEYDDDFTEPDGASYAELPAAPGGPGADDYPVTANPGGDLFIRKQTVF